MIFQRNRSSSTLSFVSEILRISFHPWIPMHPLRVYRIVNKASRNFNRRSFISIDVYWSMTVINPIETSLCELSMIAASKSVKVCSDYLIVFSRRPVAFFRGNEFICAQPNNRPERFRGALINDRRCVSAWQPLFFGDGKRSWYRECSLSARPKVHLPFITANTFVRPSIYKKFTQVLRD